jgi:DNA polymerase-3 subunit delta
MSELEKTGPSDIIVIDAFGEKGSGGLDLKTLKKDIISGNIPRICLFYGEENYLKEYYLGMIEKKVVAEGTEQFNKVVIEEPADVEIIKNACNTLPFFSDKKLVVVRKSGLFSKGTKKPAGIDGLIEFLKEFPEHTCLVFLENDINRTLSATSAVKKHGVIVEFDYLKPRDLVKWVTTIINKRGREISYSDACLFVEYCSEGMFNILNEIEKLIAYTEGSGNKITGDDIKTVCTRSIKSKVFDLTDAVAARNCSNALKVLDEILMLKEPVPKILFLIAKQIRQLIQVKSLKKEGLGRDRMAARMKLHPFIAAKILKQSESFEEDELKEILKKCHEADYSIKSGRIVERTAMELLLSEIALAKK